MDSRIDQDFIIMGRTVALAVNGLNDALDRGNRMIKAGADIIFAEAPQTIGDMEKINRIIEGPTFIVYLEGGKIPLSPPGEFEKLGYNVVAYAVSGLYAAARRMGVIQGFQGLRAPAVLFPERSGTAARGSFFRKTRSVETGVRSIRRLSARPVPRL